MFPGTSILCEEKTTILTSSSDSKYSSELYIVDAELLVRSLRFDGPLEGSGQAIRVRPWEENKSMSSGITNL